MNISDKSFRQSNDNDVERVSVMISMKGDGTLLTYEINAYRKGNRPFTLDDVSFRRVGHRSAIEPALLPVLSYFNTKVS